MKRLARNAAELMTLSATLQADGIQLELLSGPLQGVYDPNGAGAFQSFAMDHRETAARTSRYACRRASASSSRCVPSRSKPKGRVLQKGLPDTLRRS
ncbi:hypothetical protein ACFY3J_04470 [Streptomyces sp. NPDC001231]|uniref:hypothetical protein n=1 Tax=Streptomyces sp. NPDC001231 TaxID=3364549 RepID=UPI0036D0FAED